MKFILVYLDFQGKKILILTESKQLFYSLKIMRGDILIIGEHHRKAADGIYDLIIEKIRSHGGKYFITIAGESGAGKSEIASALKNLLDKQDIPATIIQQDDYFVLPPKTNEKARVVNSNRVGPEEVRLDLLNENIKSISAGELQIDKPLVIFGEDRITQEILDIKPYRVIIVDGTYTTMLDGIDCHVFIDRDRDDTRKDRLKRNREKQNEYLEHILEIEHNIISRHKEMANIIISKEFKAYKP
jgi:uridine kinase